MSTLYFDETLTRESFSVGATLTIRGAEAHHAVSVSRVAIGEQILIGDGRGVRASVTVTDADQNALSGRIEAITEQPDPRPAVLLVQALAKGDRDERAIEACTELGIDEVMPLHAQRSVARWNAEKAVKGRERWQKIVREASKQALRHRIPHVHPLASLADLVSQAADQTMLVLEPSALEKLSEVSASMLAAKPLISLIVGPEGGLDPREVDALVAAGAQPVRLGDTVLRTSTAGVAAMSVLNVTLGRW